MKANAPNPQTDRQTDGRGGWRKRDGGLATDVHSCSWCSDGAFKWSRKRNANRANRKMKPEGVSDDRRERRGARHVAPRPPASPGLFFLWVKGRAGSPPCLKLSRELRLSCVGVRCECGILSSHGALHRFFFFFKEYVGFEIVCVKKCERPAEVVINE